MTNAQSIRVIFRVADFDRSVRFYRDVLQMEEIKRWDKAEGPGLLLQTGTGRIIELFGPPQGQRHDDQVAANVELGFEVDDVDGWHDRLEAAGVSIARGLVDNPWGDRSFGVDDPDGVRIWFFQLIPELSTDTEPVP